MKYRSLPWFLCVIGLAFGAPSFVRQAGAATISGFSPDRGSTGTEVLITGTSLSTSIAVYFGSLDAAGEILSRSATAVRARVPANAFTGQISIFTSGSGVATSNPGFPFIAAPRITEFSPLNGVPGTVVTISGANFGTANGGVGNVTNVFFGTSAARFQINGINQLLAVVPTNANTGPITLANAAGTFSTLESFQIPAQILSITPSSGAPGDPITLLGQNLATLQRLDLGLVSVPFSSLTTTSLVFRVPTNAVHAPLSAITPAGTTITSSNFLIRPRIISFAPAGGVVGAAVRLEGGGFQGVTEVRFNGTKATFQVISPMRVDTTVPAGATTGPLALVTTNGTFTTETLFALPPRLTTFNPSTGKRGDTVTLDGQGLDAVTKVTISGIEAEFTVVSPTRLVAIVPALATSGRINIESAGGSALSGGTFTVLPVIDSFAPGHGPVGSAVNLLGAGLTNLATVRLGDLDASFTVVNSTNVRVIVPLNAFSGPLLVRTLAGTELLTTDFFVDGARPALTAFTPASGPVGTKVLLQGEGFRTASRVQIGSTEASFVRRSSQQLEVTIPAGATSGRFAVTTLDGIALSDAVFSVGPSVVSLIVNRVGNTLQLRWPTAATGFTLESAAALGAGTTWQAIATGPTTDGTNYLVTWELSPVGATYFRLRH